MNLNHGLTKPTHTPPPPPLHTHISPHTPLSITSCKGLKVKEERISDKLRNRLPFHILSVYKLFTWSDLGYSIILLVVCFMINWNPYNTILYYLGLAC